MFNWLPPFFLLTESPPIRPTNVAAKKMIDVGACIPHGKGHFFGRTCLGVPNLARSWYAQRLWQGCGSGVASHCHYCSNLCVLCWSRRHAGRLRAGWTWLCEHCTMVHTLTTTLVRRCVNSGDEVGAAVHLVYEKYWCSHAFVVEHHTPLITYIHILSSLHACHSTRSLRLSNTNLLSAPFVHTSFGSRSFSIAAPKIWNSLPLSLRTCTSPDTFRRHLKTHYCQQAFQST